MKKSTPLASSLIPEYDSQSLYPYRKALSSSQFLRYEESPELFYTEYVMGIKKPPSKPMLIGSVFSALHADRQFDFRQALADINAPKHLADLFEREIKKLPVVPAEVPLICNYNGWELRATLDGFVEDEYTIIENKTGQTEWTQERANYSDQITFQAFCHWKKYGVIPKKIIVNWLCTKSKSNGVRTFKTSRSIQNLKNFSKRIDVVLANIEAENWTTPIYRQ